MNTESTNPEKLRPSPLGPRYNSLLVVDADNILPLPSNDAYIYAAAETLNYVIMELEATTDELDKLKDIYHPLT